jgi:hypothetical protein
MEEPSDEAFYSTMDYRDRGGGYLCHAGRRLGAADLASDAVVDEQARRR